MSDRIAMAFARAAKEQRAALVTFVTAGDPTPAICAEVLDALVEGGADVIELGMPFTDPMADGQAIQRANLRSLGAGTRTADVLALASAFRQRHPHVPLILMGYANPMTIRGADWFAEKARKAGIDGVICVDIPPEEDREIGPQLRAEGVHLIRLATPTTDDKRLPAVLDGASGFLYYVAVAGITGANSAVEQDVAEAVQRLKAMTDLPVAVGFGVRTPEQAAAIARHADGVVIGSALVSLVEEGAEDAPRRIRDMTARLSAAILTARRSKAA